MARTTPSARRDWTDARGKVIDEEDRGLVYDVQTLLSRRRALGLFGALGAGVLVAGCSGTSDSPASSGGSTTASGSAPASGTPSSPGASAGSSTESSTGSGVGSGQGASVSEVPDETGGPFPGDGSNGVNVLDDSGIVRSDIRSGFGSSSASAEGIPLTIRLTVRDSATGDAKAGAAVYVWHCDREGNYSLYSSGFEDVNYLRGVQSADDTGTVTFSTVFPGCYPGRWPHVHFEVYESLDGATSEGPIVKTSQIALPKEACEAAYATEGYEQSTDTLAQTSLRSDMVFGDDGGIHQLASMSGSAADGYVATLTIGV